MRIESPFRILTTNSVVVFGYASVGNIFFRITHPILMMFAVEVMKFKNTHKIISQFALAEILGS